MKRNHFRPISATAGVLLLLSGCSSPTPVLYTIAPISGTARSGSPQVVVLRQIAVARYLERTQIVRSSENYELRVASNDWWGEPLAGMLGRVLVTELGQRLPQSTVVSETGAVSATPDLTVELNIQRLDQDSSGNLVLQAQTSVSAKDQDRPSLGTFTITVPPASPTIQGEVGQISTAVGQLADKLAPMIKSEPVSQ